MKIKGYIKRAPVNTKEATYFIIENSKDINDLRKSMKRINREWRICTSLLVLETGIMMYELYKSKKKKE